MQSNETDPQTTSRRSWPRRHPGLAILLVVAALLIGLRALLPIAAEIAIERGVTGLIAGSLEVGDVDLSLLRATLVLEDATLSAEGEPPVARIDRLEAVVALRELLERSVRIRAMDVSGFHLLVRRDRLGEFELIALLLPPEQSSEPPEEAAEAGQGTDDAPGWSFALDLAALEGGAIRFRDLGAEEPGQWQLELDELTARRLGVEPGAYERPARLSFAGSVLDADLTFEGTVDRSGESPRVDLALDVEALPIGAMSAYVGGIAWSELGGRLDAAITYSGDVRTTADVSADLSLRDFSARSPGSEDPELRWELLQIRAQGTQANSFASVGLSGEITLEKLSTDSGEKANRCLGSLGGLKALVSEATFKASGKATGKAPGRAAGDAADGGSVITARIDELELREPDLRLVRGAKGFSCRLAIADAGADAGAEAGAQAGTGSDAESSTDDGSGTDDGAGATAEPTEETGGVAESAAESEAGRPTAFAFEIVRLEVKDGRLVLRDRLVEPFVETSLAPLETRIDDLSGPPASIERFELSAGGLGSGPLAASGSFRGGELIIEAGVERVEIGRFNPYLARYSTLAAKRGFVSSQIDLRAEPQGLIRGRLRIRLQEAAFGTFGKKSLAQKAGVSLPLAMALLRNPGGDIELDVPFSREKGVTDIDLLDLIARATGRAVFNSLLSPLKVVGSVVVRDGAVQRFEPEPVEFAPGRSELTEAGGERVRALAEVFARRPGLGVQLDPRVVQADAEWLGRSPEAPPPGPDAFTTLGVERANRVADALAEEHGVSRERIGIAPASGALAEGQPRVDLGLAPIDSLPEAEEDEGPASPDS